MKVLLMSTSSDAGGGPQVVLDLAKGLQAAGVKVAVMLPRGGIFVQQFKTADIATFEVALNAVSPGVLYKVWRIVAFNNYDVLHSHGKGAGLYARIVGFVIRTPVVHTHHGIFFERYNRFVTTVYINYERILSWVTRKVINVSRGQEQLGLNLGIFPPSKSMVVYNARPTDDFFPADSAKRKNARKQIGIQHADELVLLNVARLHSQKNHTRLLELFGKLQQQVTRPLKLVIVGGGELHWDLLKTAEELHIAESVLFAGEQSAVKPYYDAADIYVTSSVIEGLPVTLIEAQLCGLPILASDVVGNNDAAL